MGRYVELLMIYREVKWNSREDLKKKTDTSKERNHLDGW